MKSISFPNMFTSSSTLVVKDYDATLQNMKLLLGSEKGSLLGDPFFGIRIKKYAFNQNDYVLKDIIIDEIFTQLRVFMPQLTISRKDINIFQKNDKLVATIRAINKQDFTTNMYNLELFNEDK